MAENRNYRTGDRVTNPGEYICEAGERKNLREGEAFPVCPVDGGETTWRQGENR
jgi:hypothetical protein